MWCGVETALAVCFCFVFLLFLWSCVCILVFQNTRAESTAAIIYFVYFVLFYIKRLNIVFVHWWVLFSYSFSDFQTTSSMLCFAHWRVSPTDGAIFHKALCNVSTVSFPLQSRRIRSCSSKDRSLEWTRRLPVEMTDPFGSPFPLCRIYWLWCCVYFPAWE